MDSRSKQVRVVEPIVGALLSSLKYKPDCH